jgi:hypothetical protein
MAARIIGRRVMLAPLKGESEFDRDLDGVIDGTLEREGIKKSWTYYVVRLETPLTYAHPGLSKTLRLDRVLVLPDGTRLEWAFFGGGPADLPVLVKIFGVAPDPTSGQTDLSKGEIFLLARATATG